MGTVSRSVYVERKYSIAILVARIISGTRTRDRCRHFADNSRLALKGSASMQCDKCGKEMKSWDNFNEGWLYSCTEEEDDLLLCEECSQEVSEKYGHK